MYVQLSGLDRVSRAQMAQLLLDLLLLTTMTTATANQVRQDTKQFFVVTTTELHVHNLPL
jgi:hypothetical protein